MKSTKLYIDIDGVVSNLAKGTVDKYNELFPNCKRISVDDVTTYDFSSVMEEHIFRQILASPGFFRNLEMMPGVIDNLNHLLSCNKNFIPYFVTKLPTNGRIYPIQSVADDKSYWFYNNIVKNVDKVKIDNLIMCFSKRWVSGKHSIMLDDYIKNLESFNGMKIIMDWPYNRNCNDAELGLHRVSTWEQFVCLIKDDIAF